MEIITSFLYQIIFIFGSIVIFGFLLDILNYKLFYRILYRTIGYDAGVALRYITGIIGTPIHELSHALMAVIFGHKVTEIKLFIIDSEEYMGYIKHTYNRKNIYHQIGNFFIGVGPILGGSGIMLFLMYLLVPNVYSNVMEILKSISLLPADLFNLSAYAGYLGLLWKMFFIIFDFSNINNVFWWIFIILALIISHHMTLSKSDIKSAVKGFVFSAILLLIADSVIFLISLSILNSVTQAMSTFGLLITSFLTISAVFSIAWISIALIIMLIKEILLKIRR